MTPKRKPAPKATRASDTARLVSQLEIHKAELELQNDELRATRGVVETALERYTEVFDFAPIGYAALDASGAIREINRAGCDLLGTTMRHAIGKRFVVFVTPRSIRAYGAMIASAKLRTGAAHSEILLEGHPPVPARLTATMLRRGPTTIQLAFEDISERVAKEAELARTAAALAEANRRKDDFLAVLSHELRNPLAPIRMSVDVLRLAPAGSDTAQRALGIIDRAAAHLSRLVEDLLDISRIQRGKIDLHREPLELGALVRRAVEDQQAGFASSGLALDVKVSDEVCVEGDAARLVQVISNLLGNARKFTPIGGRVAVSVERRGDHATVTVRDTGIGIAPGVITTLFEPFAQAPQALARQPGGLGLGLATVKLLVELHGGRTALRSQGLGKGTEVTFTLPVQEPPRHDAAEPGEAARCPRRILVIEDMPETAQSLVDALMLHGHTVEVAHDGSQGLEVAAVFQPEIVLCDVGLPEIDGYEVARRLREHATLRDTYLVALSGYARPEDVDRAIVAGFAVHLAKPVGLEDIERVLARAPLRRLLRDHVSAPQRAARRTSSATE